MSKQVYISADYDAHNGDQNVVNELVKWGRDSYHVVDFIDMAKVSSGSVANGDDCRICDLKREFNRQINASSAVIFVVGDATGSRTAGNSCTRVTNEQYQCYCTPYKQNTNGVKQCKVSVTFSPGPNDDVGCINGYSYLRHEFEQAKKKKNVQQIVILYNSIRYESSWLPDYMKGYENCARPFWVYNSAGVKVGDYTYIKEVLGF